MTDLSVGDFAAFFEAIHGVPPFPWQQALVERLARGEGWPALMDLPTGVGKTAALDAAIFHLALEASPTGTRTAPRRIVFVVDRRTIVDQAHRRAEKIARAIDDASGRSPVLQAVRARLRAMMRQPLGRESTLLVALLRGGMPKNDTWAKTPDQPVVAVSTVDQVGSRLLFRGYGVSHGMKPLHAGLLGNDVLWLLDEVHLSEPFRQTLAHVARSRGWATELVAGPFAVVEMSATPGRAKGDDVFGLGAADRKHPVLARRLMSRKPTSVVTDLKGAAFDQTVVREAKKAIEAGATAIGVVVNRVQAARELWRELDAKLKGADVELVTGRMRPLDRDALERRLRPRIGAGERVRGAGQRPSVVVATQCIAAGADFDFDVLVTEAASLDALRQRFGRLNRLGELDEARGAVLGRSGVLKGDPVYGDALAATLDWLSGQAALDFGPAHMRLPESPVLETLVTQTKDAPVMLPGHLDAWVQTAPMPEPDPDVALWLHGPQRGSPEVRLVWRADIARQGEPDRPVELDAARADEIAEVLAALPPTPGEALAVPLGALRRWLAGLPEPSLADVEGQVRSEDDDRADVARARLAVRWTRDGADVIRPDELRPDDTIVVPTSYGGLTRGTWDPSSGEPVADRAEEAWFLQRGRAALRLHPAVLGALAGPTLDEQQADRDVVGAWVEEVAGVASGVAGQMVSVLRREVAKRWRVLRVPRLDADDGEENCVVLGRKQHGVDAEGMSSAGEDGSFTGRPVTLAAHLRGVGEWAGDFARRVGLPDALIDDVTLAAAWHDAGKADRRFQRLLHGGDRFKTEVAEAPLAKSGVAQNDRRARKRAQKLSEYPPGARHEVLSVALLAGSEALRRRAHDWELVLHLVAAHHGYCRPWAPVVVDERPIEVELVHEGLTVRSATAHGLERFDSGIGERFWTLVRRYGWWGLAWLETLVRLGDHRRSEAEQLEEEA
ncbi:MAG: type I-U CRISPR-associated helicase/endonuclease Cas3 [Polyangiaceae bacterium]|nr:type I-U CRISPR-associated helicase/endonuclease Cas3 [Polyangiaceae bacterium]